MKQKNKNCKKITKGKCEYCKEKATALFKTKEVCERCYNKLNKPKRRTMKWLKR